jgi:hypothetical protein
MNIKKSQLVTKGYLPFYDTDWYFEMKPCWIIGRRPKDGYAALEKMRKHDRVNNFPKAEFVGEIK